MLADLYGLLNVNTARVRAELAKHTTEIRTQLSRSRLAIVPGYSHYNLIGSPEVPEIIQKFLADPLTNSPRGAAAASQVAPVRDKE
jgi:hypothetical protein